MPNPVVGYIGASVVSGIVGSRSASRAADVQASAIADSQQILADSNIEAARLVAEGQHAAAAAIVKAGETAAAATLEAAKLSREQIDKFFVIAKTDIAEKLEMSRNDINAGLTNARDVLSPYNKQGLIAGRELASMVGIADDQGNKVDFDQSKLEALPQYQFQMDQGMKAIDRGSRSKLSGGQLKDLQAYGSGLASNVYNERIQQLLGLDSMGLSAANSIASAEMGAGAGLASVNTSAAGQLAQSAGASGTQNAQIAQNTGNNLSNIALNTGNSLANNSIAGANALAGLQSQYGTDMANLTMGAGAAEAGGITGSSNAWTNALNTAAMGYGLSSNPLMTSGTTWGSVPATSSPNAFGSRQVWGS